VAGLVGDPVLERLERERLELLDEAREFPEQSDPFRRWVIACLVWLLRRVGWGLKP
jgi:hypothetical protein